MAAGIGVSDLNTYATNTWCPGCGNFAIERAAKLAFVELVSEGEVKRENLVMLSGIGCHGKIADYIDLNSFYSIHGRVPGPATGIRLANRELVVVGFAGDGDAYGEGLDHLIFAAKRNVNMTMIIHDNRVYGLTTGQFTPTSPKGFEGKSTPRGAPEGPINPIQLMLSVGATFVARAYSGRLDHMKDVFKRAIMHKGFALVDALQPCFTFFDTYSYYNSRVYDLQDEKHDHADWNAALAKSREWDYGGEESGRIPIGIFYQAERPTYEDAVVAGKNLLDSSPPGLQDLLREHM